MPYFSEIRTLKTKTNNFFKLKIIKILELIPLKLTCAILYYYIKTSNSNSIFVVLKPALNLFKIVDEIKGGGYC